MTIGDVGVAFIFDIEKISIDGITMYVGYKTLSYYQHRLYTRHRNVVESPLLKK